jgi:hypothetical protein
MEDCVILRAKIEKGINFSWKYLALLGPLKTHTVNAEEKAMH